MACVRVSLKLFEHVGNHHHHHPCKEYNVDWGRGFGLVVWVGYLLLYNKSE